MTETRKDFLDKESLEYPLIDNGDKEISDGFVNIFKWVLHKLTPMDKCILISQLLVGESYGDSFNISSRWQFKGLAFDTLGYKYKLGAESKKDFEQIATILKKHGQTGIIVLPLGDNDE